MSHSQFHSTNLFILRHAWLNLWDKHMTTGRINQVTTDPRCAATGDTSSCTGSPVLESQDTFQGWGVRHKANKCQPFSNVVKFWSAAHSVPIFQCCLFSFLERDWQHVLFLETRVRCEINLVSGLTSFRYCSPCFVFFPLREKEETKITAFSEDYRQPDVVTDCNIQSENTQTQSRRIPEWLIAHAGLANRQVIHILRHCRHVSQKNSAWQERRREREGGKKKNIILFSFLFFLYSFCFSMRSQYILTDRHINGTAWKTTARLHRGVLLLLDNKLAFNPLRWRCAHSKYKRDQKQKTKCIRLPLKGHHVHFLFCSFVSFSLPSYSRQDRLFVPI